MLKLQGKLQVERSVSEQPYLVTLTKNGNLPPILRRERGLLTEGACGRKEYKAIFCRGAAVPESSHQTDVFRLTGEYDYLDEGDIVKVDPMSGSFRCLYRRGSLHNTILLTEQCDHYCLMCSQPPKPQDDSWLLTEAFDLIRLIPQETQRLGFSGGEPTLYRERLIDLLHHTLRYLPRTALDILSNGRAFKDRDFARAYAAVNHPNLVVGIPIYSDDPVRHDYVVQSQGAFDETVRGILNLKQHHQKVEVRIVLHQQTVGRLVQTCEFIVRNLLFVDHVALMGLEITGFTRPNLELLWIDPYEYKEALSEAVALLTANGVPTSVYNHQLCTVNPDIWENCRQSISDWKREYVDGCAECSKRGQCGGLFSSSKAYRHSSHIRAFT
ncbi:MAG: His-Xaa-Ser system radical SAM maturase HxsC [Nitrospira sp.]|jgi:His-Xaa-Ser system radical SAM maturase HxsC|nr:MAG: His-Xaa-Ser system radical SAM maturase HxsC [Nitrospira sp.]